MQEKMLGFLFMDPIASVVICVFIVKASVSIFIYSIGKMTDKSAIKKYTIPRKGLKLDLPSIV